MFPSIYRHIFSSFGLSQLRTDEETSRWCSSALTRAVSKNRATVAMWGGDGFRVSGLKLLKLWEFVEFFGLLVTGSSGMERPLVSNISKILDPFDCFNVDDFGMKSLLVYIVYMMCQSTVLDGQLRHWSLAWDGGFYCCKNLDPLRVKFQISRFLFFQIFFSLVSRDWYKTKAGGKC